MEVTLHTVLDRAQALPGTGRAHALPIADRAQTLPVTDRAHVLPVTGRAHALRPFELSPSSPIPVPVPLHKTAAHAAIQRAIALASRRGTSAAPWVSHASALRGDWTGREAIVGALEMIARRMSPVATSFFRVGADGEIASSIGHAPQLAPATVARLVRSWKAALHGIDPLAPRRLPADPPRVITLRDLGSEALRDPELSDIYRRLGILNDVRVLIRDGGRVVAGVTLWRPWGAPPWTADQLRLLRSLQPLIELAYLSQRERETTLEAQLPESLTRREREVVRVLATGASNAELARTLHVSENTAKSHTRAVLAKLGLPSRRALVLRQMRAAGAGADGSAPGQVATGASDPLRPARREPGDPPVWAEGDEPPLLMLSTILGWASEHLGATVGGCALISPRQTVTGVACATAAATGHRLSRLRLRKLNGELLAPAVARRLGDDAALPAVVPLAPDGPVEAQHTGAQLSGELGLETPVFVLLRPYGRVAAVAWLARDARSSAYRPDLVRELRRIHPLLELAFASALGTEERQPDGRARLEDVGLTPRELAVAQLAVSGASNAQIAAELGIGEPTVRNHMTRVLAKCGVRSRTRLIATFGHSADDDGHNSTT